MNKAETRKQKINLLKGVSTGTTTINELQPFRVEFWTRFEGDLWTNEKTDEQITNDQLQAKKRDAKNNNKLLFITVVKATGNEKQKP